MTEKLLGGHETKISGAKDLSEERDNDDLI